ncbi:MAG: DEAD/DEAH box helicase [Ruminococcus sp.]|nr:DEAD/DEAH box helicase [Ruminococcus sp.]
MIELYRHQKIALSYLRVNKFFALFMEQGTGKTLVALFRILDLLKSGEIDNALIVTIKAGIGSWERDIEKFDDLDREILSSSVEIINYDKVWRGEKKSPYYKKYGCIVLDESHEIKNRSSRRSNFLLKLSVMANYRYILTGSPIGNGQLENIWSQYCFLDPYIERGRVYSRLFGGSYQSFQDRYCILNMYHKPTSYIRVSELQRIINANSYRVKKAECMDLPEKLPDEVIKIDLTDKQRTLYKKLVTESALLDYEVLAENPLSRLVKLRQLCSGYLKVDPNVGEDVEIRTNKNSLLGEYLDTYSDEKKLVIFAEFKYSIKSISTLLQKKKIKHVVLDGDQKDKKIWRQFQGDPSIKIIVCQYKTANASIDLYASDTIIFYEPTIRSLFLEQARDRIHRPGQLNKCSFIHFLTKGTIEVDIYRALSGYSDFNETLFTRYIEGYRRTYCQ